MTKAPAGFNGLFGGLLCLSHKDACADAGGNLVTLREGVFVTAFDEDAEEDGMTSSLRALWKSRLIRYVASDHDGCYALTAMVFGSYPPFCTSAFRSVARVTFRFSTVDFQPLTPAFFLATRLP